MPNQRDTTASQKNFGMAGHSVAAKPAAIQSTDIASTTSVATMVPTTTNTSGEITLDMGSLSNFLTK